MAASSPTAPSVPYPAIACTLSLDELRARRGELLPGLVAQALLRSPLSSGMRFRFPATAELMRQITSVVQRERQCCPFLTFRVELDLGGRALTLDVTGPEGTADMLSQLLDAGAVPA